MSNRSAQRGDVTIYLALTLLTVMASATLLFGGLLLGQLRTTQDVVESERSFYAANAGLERGFYELSLFATSDRIPLSDGLVYPGTGTQAVYQGTAVYGSDGLTPCVKVTGAYPVRDNQSFPDNAPQAQERRLSLGPANCLP